MKKLFLALSLSALTAGALAAPPALTVYKDANCGCCEAWVDHLKEAGFSTRVVNASDVAAIKAKLGVPERLASCHTAVLDGTGQVVEGHVPAAAIRKLVATPSLRGVAVPGMPANSPGMGKMDGNLVTVDFGGKPFSRD